MQKDNQQPAFKLSELPMPMVFAAHRTIRDCNAEFARLFGYEQNELRHTGFHLLYPKFADFVRVGEMWKANFGGDRVYYDERLMLHRDQSAFWCRVRGRARLDVDPFAEAIYCFEPMTRPVRQADSVLTDRQLQIVTLVAQGKINREIAIETGLSKRTIEAHRARIMRAVGVRNSAELVAWFHA